jgi:hypothetical protein
VGNAMAEAFYCPPPTACFHVRSSKVLVKFVMDEVTLGQVVFEICRFYPAKIFTVTTHTHLHLNTAVSRKYAEAEKASKCNLFLKRRSAR